MFTCKEMMMQHFANGPCLTGLRFPRARTGDYIRTRY